VRIDKERGRKKILCGKGRKKTERNKKVIYMNDINETRNKYIKE
jgi:hypothetical protein